MRTGPDDGKRGALFPLTLNSWNGRLSHSFMSIYSKQREYLEKAYESGEHGWPTLEPTPFVVDSIKELIKGKKLEGVSRVLDLGCGEGRHTFASAELGLQTVGLDYQALAIDRARAMPKAKTTRGGYSFLLGDVFNLPFNKGVFDLVIDWGCFHHVKKSDTTRYLKNLLFLLSERAWFILSCFSTEFRHYPGDHRKRDWLVHAGHYDRFFKKSDFKRIFGQDFLILNIGEERSGLYSFYQVLMQRKV